MGKSALGFYLKPGVRASAPGVLFSLVVTEHIPDGGSVGNQTFRVWGGADVCCSHWRRGKWTRTRSARCETPEALAEWMEANSDPRRRNWVVSPDAGGALAQSDTWWEIDKGPVLWVPPGTHNKKTQTKKWRKVGTTIRKAVVNPRAVIVDYTRKERRWVWVSGRQYFTATEDTLAEAFGFKWPVTGDWDRSAGEVTRQPCERALMWLKAIQELTVWWRANAKAPFGYTASGLAMGILRSHVGEKALCSHGREWVHRLEREACFGGSARTWYYGDIGTPSDHGTDRFPAPPPSEYGSLPGPVTLADVRSMYPYLLRENAFPVSCTGHVTRCNPTDPQHYAECCGIIARVTIETDTPEYPMRLGQDIVYPVGRFDTVLTGPELLALRRDGKIVKCHEYAKYHLGRPFRDAAAALIQMREEARALGRPGWELLAKQIANGMGGKLAQRKGQWIDRVGYPAQMQFGEWYERRGSTDKVQRFRALAGCVSMYETDPTGAGPYTFAFAYLCALGRLHMRRIRDACPARSVVSMDTDGVWLLPHGVPAVARFTRGGRERAGDLRIEGAHECGRFLDPRHYFLPGRWVLAGFSSPVVTARGTGVLDSARAVPLAGPAGHAPRGVCVTERASTLAITARGVRIGPDGWAVPKERK